MAEKILESIALTTRPGVIVSVDLPLDDGVHVSFTDANNGLVNLNGKKIQYTPNEDFTGLEVIQVHYKKNGNETLLTLTIKVGYAFKAKSHILTLLGDELIGSDNLAIFELVKNAYDADAEEVKITFKGLNTPTQSIIIEDDGHGMSLDVIKNVWLEIGTDFKRGIKRKSSNKFKRISLGEKGVGRLAVHKLGKSIVLETQPENSNCFFRLSLNWQQLMDNYDYIDETAIEVSRIDGALSRKARGTRIIINDLKKKTWTRGELRDLTRKVNSIISPFKKVKGTFNVIIDAEDHQGWIDDVKNIETLLNDSIYYFEFSLKKQVASEFARLTWTYKFTPPKSLGLAYNSIEKADRSDTDKAFNTFDIRVDRNDGLYKENQKHLRNDDLNGIGEITGYFYVYNLLSVVLKSFGQTQAIKNFVKDNSGVKIFRDGIRVYNYGEPNDDWLGLDLSRVQRLGSHFSKNTTIGAIEITQEGSFQNLKEKTNREGFDENPTFLKFKDICQQVFRLFETTAQKDRDVLKENIDGLTPVRTVGLPNTLNQLNDKLKSKNLEKELSPLLKRVEKEYNSMRDVMLNSGMTGINLGIVFHEVDREIHFINADLKNNVSIDGIKRRVKNLIQLLDNFSPILKQNKYISISASQLVERAKQINSSRFLYHQVIFSSPLISKENTDFEITGPGNLLISAISNIIDNSIYWVSNKKELEEKSYKPAIYIGTDMQNFNGPAIILADNGNGFTMEPEDLTMPYRTTRPGGMGLGLYFVNLVMEMIGGKLVFPDSSEATLPKVYNGAIVALIFPKK